MDLPAIFYNVAEVIFFFHLGNMVLVLNGLLLAAMVGIPLWLTVMVFVWWQENINRCYHPNPAMRRKSYVITAARLVRLHYRDARQTGWLSPAKNRLVRAYTNWSARRRQKYTYHRVDFFTLLDAQDGTPPTA